MYLYTLPPYLITIDAENGTSLLTIKKYVIHCNIVYSIEIVLDSATAPLSERNG